MGFQLVQGVYVPIRPGDDGHIHSDVLGLDFVIQERRLRVYEPVGGEWLQTPAEAHAERAENAEARAENAEARAECQAIAGQQQIARAENAEACAEQETIARQKAEAEVERLREQLARLQASLQRE